MFWREAPDDICSQIITFQETAETLINRDAIVVTIPFNRLNLGNDTQVTPQVMTQVDTQVKENETVTIEQKIIEFCVVPRSTKEIAEMLGYKEGKSAA